MKKLVFGGFACIVVGCLAVAPALTQMPNQQMPNQMQMPLMPMPQMQVPNQTSRKSVESRSAACRADCRSGNTHGMYKAYADADPNLTSPEGRKMYDQCVRLCLAPLPANYFQ